MFNHDLLRYIIAIDVNFTWLRVSKRCADMFYHMHKSNECVERYKCRVWIFAQCGVPNYFEYKWIAGSLMLLSKKDRDAYIDIESVFGIDFVDWIETIDNCDDSIVPYISPSLHTSTENTIMSVRDKINKLEFTCAASEKQLRAHPEWINWSSTGVFVRVCGSKRQYRSKEWIEDNIQKVVSAGMVYGIAILAARMHIVYGFPELREFVNKDIYSDPVIYGIVPWTLKLLTNGKMKSCGNISSPIAIT